MSLLAPERAFDSTRRRSTVLELVDGNRIGRQHRRRARRATYDADRDGDRSRRHRRCWRISSASGSWSLMNGHAHPHLPPIGLLAELTHRCPLRCPYCSNPLELDRRSGELDTETWQRVLSEAAALGVLHVHLSGGEPTARRDIVDHRSPHCAKLGLYSNLITSGVGRRRQARGLVAAGLDHVQLSVQGATAANGDRIGGLKGAPGAKARLRRARRRARPAADPQRGHPSRQYPTRSASSSILPSSSARSASKSRTRSITAGPTSTAPR